MKRKIKNITLYRFETDTKDKFNIVDSFYVHNYGPYCNISVYLENRGI